MKKQATLKDWCIVKFPEIYANIDTPSRAFTKFEGVTEVVLFGRASNDPRYDAVTGEFADGHRVATSPIVEVKDGIYYTENTAYVLCDEDKNKEYLQWCAEV